MKGGDVLLQRFPSRDGKRWIELPERRDGMFYFRRFYEATTRVPDVGSETLISPVGSGAYTNRRTGRR
jgi:hypothetical protein